MIKKHTWKDFLDSGMLFYANTILHFTGWAIVVEEDDEGVIQDVYPARTPYRGFSPDSAESGFQRFHAWMANHAQEIKNE